MKFINLKKFSYMEKPRLVFVLDETDSYIAGWDIEILKEDMPENFDRIVNEINIKVEAHRKELIDNGLKGDALHKADNDFYYKEMKDYAGCYRKFLKEKIPGEIVDMSIHN